MHKVISPYDRGFSVPRRHLTQLRKSMMLDEVKQVPHVEPYLRQKRGCGGVAVEKKEKWSSFGIGAWGILEEYVHKLHLDSVMLEPGSAQSNSCTLASDVATVRQPTRLNTFLPSTCLGKSSRTAPGHSFQPRCQCYRVNDKIDQAILTIGDTVLVAETFLLVRSFRR